MNAESVCLEIAADFKRNGISYKDAAQKLGQSIQTVYNRLASKRFFGETAAKHWAETFDYNKVFLMTGEGSLHRINEKSIYYYCDNIEILVLAADYLLSLAEDDTIRRMWIALLNGEYKVFRELEAQITKDRGRIQRLPNDILKRLVFLSEYEFMS